MSQKVQKVQKSPSVEQSSVVTPYRLIQIAVEKNADPDQLNKLLDFQERCEAKDARMAFEKAITQFRQECPAIEKTREGYGYNYAGLAESLDTIKEALGSHGLSVRWNTDADASQIVVTCILSHVGGHQEKTSLPAPPDTSGKKNSVQAVGSTVSYLSRYTMFSLLGIAAQDQDTDGVPPNDPEFITAAEAAHLEKLADQVEANKKKFLAYLKVESFAQIPAAQYSAAESALKKKGAAR
mgnify:CR=1 FL=1|tara:strand:- start:3983 stop:4699 length:717 start_codon:yes stop_codon:yes gene_type:complete